MHDIFRSRLQEEDFHTLFCPLQQDEQKFYTCYIMSPHKFDQLHETIGEKLVNSNTKFRQAIETRERLTIYSQVSKYILNLVPSLLCKKYTTIIQMY